MIRQKLYHLKSSNDRSVKWEERTSFTDLEVWQAFKKGSESAFIYIYESYFISLINYGVKFTRDKELIRDCIQDMFIEIRESRANLSDTDNIKPYLFKILRIKVLKNLQRSSKQIGIEDGFKPFDFAVSHEEHLINKQLSESQIANLEKAIGNLTVKEREAIFHFYYELHSYEQIAQIMGYKDVKIARNLVYRAINSLKQSLESSGSFLFTFLFF